MKLHNTLFQSVLFAANTGGGTGPADGSPANDDTLSGVTANTKDKFMSVMDKLVKSIGNTQKLANEAATMAMEHFMAHGDCCYFQSLTDKMSKHAKNFFREVALVDWATTFAPLTFAKGKWTKDKERAEAMDWENNKTITVERDGKKVQYNTVSFWDFSPERPIEKLDAENLLKFILGKVNSKKLATRVEGDADAEATLAMLKQTLNGVKAVHIEQPAEGANAA